MRIFKATWNDKKTGETRETKNWWIETRDHLKALRRFSGFTDKKQSEALGRQIERLISTKAAGEPPDAALSRWLESTPDSLRRQLVRIGLLDPQRAAGGQPLSVHLEDFKKALIAKGGTLENARLVTNRVRRVFDESKIVYWNDIQASKILYVISNFKKIIHNQKESQDRGNISAQSYNFYVKSFKQFCKWMVLDGRATKSPVDHLGTKNVKVDRRHDRRALEPDKIRRLLEVTRQEPTRWKMTGPERALLYQLAAETGLRSNEIRSLKKSSFDFDKCEIVVKAGYSKRKREDTLPLKPEMAAAIKNHLGNKLPTAQAFTLPSKGKIATMLRQDLAAAKIDYQDEAGKFADFHSLRHTTGSLLAAAGVHPKVAQALMRHSDINLTLGRYSHIYKGQETDAIASLPDLTQPSQQAQEAQATGTDDRTAPAPGQAIARESNNSDNSRQDISRNLACFLAKIGQNQPFSADNDGQQNPTGADTRTDQKTAISSKKRGFSAKNGEGGIRTRGTGVHPYDGLANRCQQQHKTTVKPFKDKGLKQDDTQTPQSDCMRICAQVIAKYPDIMPLIEVWPCLSVEMRNGIVKMVR